MLAAVACTVWIGGCQLYASEQQLLLDFFDAAGAHDRTRLAALGTVDFNPRERGRVNAVEILETGGTATRAWQSTGDDRTIARISLGDAADSPLPSGTNLELATKRLTVDARLWRNGGSARRTLAVTLARASLQGSTARVGRWIVIAVNEADTR